MTFEFSEVSHVNVLRDSITAERAKVRGTGLDIGISLECLRSDISSFPVASWAPLVAQAVKRLSAMLETWVQSLGWEDLLEKEKAIHFSILAWRFPRTEEPGRLPFMGSQRVGHD